jgi:membrane protease YdiL (CAAX protease family)
MWLVWRFLERPGWRRDHLAAGKLSFRRWIIALTALAAGTGAIHWFRVASLRWLGLPDVRVPSLPACSVSVLLSSFLVTALAAGLFEEAGYRGYMRLILEERYGPKAAIILSALFFTIAHLSRGPGFFAALPSAFLFGGLFGLVAWKTGSIRPGGIVHCSYNLVRLLAGWFLLA